VRKRRLTLFAFLMMFGAFAFSAIAAKPRFTSYHGSDVVQLMASGACFGAGLGVLLGKRKFPDE